ncbi:MAG TPA: hypothetical protein VJ808_02645 [Gemmatimonadales bacterium]|nr:hypothetical protein [Gemmatimonadales bacterium]
MRSSVDHRQVEAALLGALYRKIIPGLGEPYVEIATALRGLRPFVVK